MKASKPIRASRLWKASTHRKEYVQWFTEAKRDDARALRVEKMKAMLSR